MNSLDDGPQLVSIIRIGNRDRNAEIYNIWILITLLCQIDGPVG